MVETAFRRRILAFAGFTSTRVQSNNPPNWQQVEALLDAVLDLPPEERPAYLDAQCADQSALRQEVEALLALETQAQARFGESLDDFAGTFVDHLHTEHEEQEATQLIGDHIGAFRIIKRVGRGGMGSVYLAERDNDSFTQQVALKIVRRGLDTDDILARFRYERQILAGLDHPHIARLIDGGITADGRPYFAMEYVDGQPITAYADANRLTTAQRLALFRTVCEAVQYAHQNLVIHRDLKPSNIFVTAEGHVKLLDFGIAKLLDEETSPAPKTRTGLQLMTPEYAAPEQVRGETVSLATDVYQLGVLLYELLTGHRPYHLPSRVQHEIERIILEEEPTRPSTVINTRSNTTDTTLTPATISATRQTSLEKLRRELSGDLDRIVLKALGKTSDLRYTTAHQFSEDVGRYLSGLPILARRPTLRYRASKFVRRHRLGVTMVLGVLLGGLAFGLYHTQRITAERNIAQREAATAQAVTTFMVDLFASNDPLQANGDTLNAFELLERGAERAISDLNDQPDVQAKVLYTFGKVYGNMGHYQKAEPYLVQALAQARTAHGASHADLIDPLASMGLVSHYLGRLDEAETYLQEAWVMHVDVHGYDHEKTAQRLEHLAFHYLNAGDYAAAESLYTQISASADRHNVATLKRLALGGQGYLAMVNGDYEAAVDMYKEALDAAYAGFDEPSAEIFLALADYGMVLGESGQYAEALRQLDAAHEMGTALYPADSNQRLTLDMNRANMHLQLRAFAKADSLYRHVLRVQQETLPSKHPSTARTQINLALSLIRQDAFAEARPLLQEGLAAYETVYDPAHPLLPETRTMWAVVLSQTGDQAEAEHVAQMALDDLIGVYGPEHYVVAIANNSLAQVLHQGQQLQDAEAHYRTALTLFQQTFSEDHADLIDLHLALGTVLNDQAKYSDAEPFLLRAHDTAQSTYGSSHPFTEQTRSALATLYTDWDKPERAAPYQRP